MRGCVPSHTTVRSRARSLRFPPSRHSPTPAKNTQHTSPAERSFIPKVPSDPSRKRSPPSLPRSSTPITLSELQRASTGDGYKDGGGALSQQLFRTLVTHALVRAHGVVGGAIPLEHLRFHASDDDEEYAGDDDAPRTRGGRDAGVGIVKCHREDADKLRTAVVMLTEAHDGRQCAGAVVASSTSLLSLAGNSRRIAAAAVRDAEGTRS